MGSQCPASGRTCLPQTQVGLGGEWGGKSGRPQTRAFQGQNQAGLGAIEGFHGVIKEPRTKSTFKFPSCPHSS